MIIDYKRVGTRISLLRKKQNLTQEQLADLVGLSIVYISNIENAKKSPTVDTLVNIANALYCTLDDLLEEFLIHKDGSLSGIAAILADCSPKEKLLIFSVIQALRESLRILL